jgi:transcriptional regulator with XRE-family HTH domain
MDELMFKLKELRRRTNLTQQALAVACGLSVRAVAAYEANLRKPEAASLLKFAVIAQQHGLSDLVSYFLRQALEQLGLQPPLLLLSHEREEKTSPPRSVLIALGDTDEDAKFIGAAGIALAMLRSKNPEQQARARAALEKLAAEI